MMKPNLTTKKTADVARGHLLKCLFALGFFFLFASQTRTSAQSQSFSSQFVDQAGLTVEKLVETGLNRRTDLLAARQRMAVAEGKVVQAGLRPNPTLEAEYGSPRFVGGEAERDFSIGLSQTFETAGKRRKRIIIAELELAQVKAEVTVIERHFAAEIRASYARAASLARQLDALENLTLANEEIMRITNERLKEGDVAPLDLNLLRVETDKLKVQIVRARAELESEMIELRALVGMDQTEPLRIAPLPQKPARLDMSLVQLTEIALRERADLQASKLGEELGGARIKLAKAQSKPNIEGTIRYSRTKGIFDLPEKLGPDLTATDRDNELTFGVRVELPFFNRNQGEVASATAEKLLAQRQRESLEAAIRRDVARSFRRYRAAAESLVLYSTQILPRSEENLRSVRAAYQLGEFSAFDVVNEQRKLIESETGYNEALRDYYAALAELESAIGTKLPSEGFSTTSILPSEEIFKRSDFLRAVTTQTVKKEN